MKKLFDKFGIYLLSAFVGLVLGMTSASAQSIVVGTGPSGFAYDTLFTQVQSVCNGEVPLVKKNSTGSTENVDMMLSNKIVAGYSQVDALYLAQKADPMNVSKLKTLWVQGSENLHFIVKSELVLKKGGYMGFGADKIPVVDVSQIAGLTVAAGGGAYASARQVRTDSEINYKIQEVKDSNAALAALKAGTVEVALVVSGPGSDTLEALPSTYRMLRISEATVSKIKGVYTPARVTYRGIAPNGVDTVAVQDVFVTRDYKTPKMVNALVELRKCVLDHLDEIKETTGTHPAWQLMHKADQDKSKWPMYQPATGTKK